MKNLYIKLSLFLLLFSVSVLAQQTPGLPQSESILITAVTAHIGNGKIIENAAIGFENGVINFVGKQSEVDQSTYDRIIKEQGRHVYPGFIVANTSSGLVEIDAVRASKDEKEVGTMLPHIRSIIAYNAESRVTESLRPNGVLMGQITPRGGRISGTSSIVQYDAWNWEDAVIKENDGIHVNWPAKIRNGRIRSGEEKGPMASKTYAKQIDELKTFLLDGKNYLSGAQNPRNLILEATEGLFNGNQRLYVHVSGSKEIIDAVNLCNDIGISKLVIVHGKEAYKVADILVENDVPVIIDRVHVLPSHNYEDVAAPYKLANKLTNLGITVGIGVEGDMERMQSRNLPFYAGTCAAYGMDKEEALKLITSNTAKILGIDEFVGTLEVGKDATLFVSIGDALDMRTNQLLNAFIQGRELSLESHQTELFDRYMSKFEND